MKKRQQAKFTFKNLQPMNYLKTFNQMIDHQTRNNLTYAKKNSLKVVSLSKFPLPKNYQNMEGIFENANKKKIIQNQTKINKAQIQYQSFMKNHNDFMRKVLQKFIKHNQNRQSTFQKQKNFYKIDFKHYRSKSQPKIDINRKQFKFIQKPEVQLSQPHATLGQQLEDQFAKAQVVEKYSPLPKLSPLKKKEKNFVRNEKKMQQYLINRKLRMNNPEQYSSAKRQNTAASKNQQFFDLKKSIVDLQMKQARRQQSFTKKVQDQIDEIQRKMNNQKHAINYFSIWKNQADSKELSKENHDYNKEYRSAYADNSGIQGVFKYKIKKS